jgi:hydroxymethylglutaryl-CoA lyase
MSANSIKIVEVAARDGLQNEKVHLSVEDRIKFIDLLADARLQWIEAGSFVHPKAVPQMLGSDQIAAHYLANPSIADLSYLVPNTKGLSIAKEHGVKHIAIFLAASEAFSMANIRKTIEESFTAIKEVVDEALENGIKVRGYLSTIFKGVDGENIDSNYVATLSQKLLAMGCYEVSLGDTTAVGKPEDTEALLRALKSQGIDLAHIAMHYHDTYGHAIANIDKAYKMGIRIFDSSTAGIGGCPFARSATGNVDTQLVVNWAKSVGIKDLGIDEQKLQKAASFVQKALMNKSSIKV